ncbi:MAG: hypothetical protein WD052_13825 [Bacteroidales bacterium]
MKTKVSFISGLLTIALALVMTTSVVFAEGEITDVYTTGTSFSSAGDFVVRTTNDVYHFQGNVYEVFKVYYDDPSKNFNIAVNLDGKCKSFIAYNREFTIFYDCTKQGFGARKIMFSNPDTQYRFDPVEYSEQTVLSDKRKIDKKTAINLIAGFLPEMLVS